MCRTENSNPRGPFRSERRFIDPFLEPRAVDMMNAPAHYDLKLGRGYALSAFTSTPRTYVKIAERVHRLKIGQHFDASGVATDLRSRGRFRSGVYSAAQGDKVSIRALPDGGIHITKVGVWLNGLIPLSLSLSASCFQSLLDELNQLKFAVTTLEPFGDIFRAG